MTIDAPEIAARRPRRATASAVGAGSSASPRGASAPPSALPRWMRPVGAGDEDEAGGLDDRRRPAGERVLFELALVEIEPVDRGGAALGVHRHEDEHVLLREPSPGRSRNGNEPVGGSVGAHAASFEG